MTPRNAVAFIGLLLGACVGGGGGTHSHEALGSSSQPLRVPGATPIPCIPDGDNGSLWSGTNVELMVADAYVACSVNPDSYLVSDFINARVRPIPSPDPYLTKIQDLIASATELLPLYEQGVPSGDLDRWIVLRNTPRWNCDPTSGRNGAETASTVDATLKPTPVGEDLWPNYWTLESKRVLVQAEVNLRYAGLNYCIAQHLRNSSPGALGAEATLMSAADQRELLEVTRERAQAAVLQYGMLGMTFGTPQYPVTNAQQEYSARLQSWASNNAGQVSVMGTDFASATSLLITVAEELTQLLARDRSAGTDKPGLQRTGYHRLWGPASWYQRGQALLFGGNPLALNEQYPLDLLGDSNPGELDSVPPPSQGQEKYPRHWPTQAELPYPAQSLLQPEIQELHRLANTHDLQKVYFTPGTSSDDSENYSPWDLDKSAAVLYRGLETRLREDEGCTTGCSPTAAFPDERYLLWDKYRLKPEHAKALVTYWGAALWQQPPGYTSSTLHDTALWGSMNVAGRVSSGTDDDGYFNRIEPTAHFVERGLQEVAPAFARNAWVRFNDYSVGQDASFSGMIDDCDDISCQVFAPSAKYRLGAMAALSIVRNVILTASAFSEASQTEAVDTFFAKRKEMVHAIDAAIGPSVSVRHSLDVDNSWTVDVRVPDADVAWWRTVGAPGDMGSVSHDVFAIRGERAANAAVVPGLEWAARYPDGVPSSECPQCSATHPYTLADAVALAESKGWKGAGAGFALVGGDTDDDELLWTGRVKFPNEPGPSVSTALLVRRTEQTSTGPLITYRFLGGNVTIPSIFNKSLGGQYWAWGGTLGEFARKQSQGRGDSPADPAFDAFGLPSTWNPEIAETLAGGSSEGTKTVQQYLDTARTAAAAAKTAIDTAIDNLIAEQSDEATQAAAAARAATEFEEAEAQACGLGNSSCAPNGHMRTLERSLFPAAGPEPTCPSDSPDASCRVDWVYENFVRKVTGQQVFVADEVYSLLGAGAVPSFANYSGGSLQAAFIEQWRAIQQPNEALRALWLSKEAAKQHFAALQSALSVASVSASRNCSENAMLNAVLAGGSISESIGVTGSVGFPSGTSVSVSVSTSVSFSPGPLIGQQEKCAAMAEQLEPQTKQAVADAWAAFAGLASAAVGVTEAQAAIAQSGAAISELAQTTELAKRRGELETAIAREGQRSSFGLQRRATSHDFWRAKALTENARRYSLAARRAIESHFVVNLSTLTGKEAFVDSPALWADEVYAYDLGVPSALGTVRSGDSSSGSIYSAKIEDYVSNLEGFVNGFTVQRPTAVSHDDIDVVDLPGFRSESSAPEIGNGAWSIRCSDGSWIPLGPADPPSEVCALGQHPERARLSFTLDPWGRINRSLVAEPFQRRYNARWGSLAVNFVGTAIKDCSVAKDVAGCYNQPFLLYDLSHEGTAWVTDFDGIWHAQAVPVGRIEGAKGMAAEMWLNPLKDGWGTSYIAPIARHEFELRPLAGAYQLEVAVGPEVVLESIERVQLLVGSSYWVAQN